jgi:biotin operon repressor
MANEEIIGYHKGALATLSKERQELAKMVGVVDQFIKMHLEELKKLGIDLEEEAKKHQESQPKTDTTQQPQDYQEEDRLA